MTKQIYLSQGKFATVDDADFEHFNQWKWTANRGGARSTSWYALRKENGKNIQMHRQIINAPDGMQVDHINRDGLDNRRENLRLCTNAENGRNRAMKSNSISGFKGVCRFRDKWQAQIGINRVNIYLGVFADPIDAAKAYDQAAIELHGPYANLNFPVSL